MPILTVGESVGKLNTVVGSEDPGERWDAFVANHPNGHLMQSRAWARVKQDTGWQSLFLQLEKGGQVCAGALILRQQIPGIGVSLLYIPRGPVLAYDDVDIVETFRTALHQVAKDQGAFLIQTDPAVPQDRKEAHAALERIGFCRQAKHGLFRIAQPIHVMRIPLDRYGGAQGLLAALPRKTRYGIRLAERKGVVIVPRVDREAVVMFHHLLVKTGHRKGFAVRKFRFHEAIWHRCVQAGLGEYLFAEHEGRVVAAILVLQFGPIAWYMYGASVAEDQKLMPTYLLQWTGISRAWASGCRCYDMRGVHSVDPKPEDPEYGVFAFKRKFNAEIVSFIGEYDLVVRPRAYRAWRVMERATQRPAELVLRLHQKLGKWL